MKIWLSLETTAELSNDLSALVDRLLGAWTKKLFVLGVWVHLNHKSVNLTTGALPG